LIAFSFLSDLTLAARSLQKYGLRARRNEIDQHPAFTACGLISRVQSLALFSNKEKLKLMLVGAVLIKGHAEPTLTLEDFVTKEPISNRSTPCANHNSGMVSAHSTLRCFREFPGHFYMPFGRSQADNGDGSSRLSAALRGISLEEIFSGCQISKGVSNRGDESCKPGAMLDISHVALRSPGGGPLQSPINGETRGLLSVPLVKEPGNESHAIGKTEKATVKFADKPQNCTWLRRRRSHVQDILAVCLEL
jgi:hypothetical protein